MTAWILLLTLATGVSGPIQVDEEACRMTEYMVSQGLPVSVRLEDDSVVEVTEAVCQPPQYEAWAGS